MPRTLMIVVASTRPNRIGKPIGDWVEARARAHDGFEIDLVDLKELDLPFVDEPNHPRSGALASKPPTPSSSSPPSTTSASPRR